MISDDYIMGFVEGEGCFSIAISKEIDRKPRKNGKKARWKKPSLGFRVKPSFRITAVEEENAVLYAIKERLGVGQVYTQKKAEDNFKPASHYYVQTMYELEKIANFFKEKEFYTSKGQSFQLWLKCLEIIKQGRHLTKEGLLEICQLRDKMNPKLGGKKARDTELIRKILEIKPEHIEMHAKQTNLLHNESTGGLESWYSKGKGKHELEQI